MHAESLRKILWITLTWILLAVAEFGYIYGTASAMGCPVSASQAWIQFTTALLSGSMAGLIGGALIVYVFNYWLRNRPYGEALLLILATFTLVFFGISIVSGFFLHSRELDLPAGRPEVVQAVFSIFYEFDTIRTYMFWFFVVLITIITLLVNEKYGPGVFRDFLLGRYFRPRREERIFMFLDLRSSTAIAEKLGEEPYFRFIQEVFRDVTPAILKNRGQIYQYVGDEVVISWPLDAGLEQGRCIACFLDIQRLLRKRAAYYEEIYGHQPEFKAGLHYGHVMAGEVGIVKREIAFSGDVLNTTARIQSKCNELGVDVLLSEKLVRALPPAIQGAARALGALPLRGKADEVVVYTM